MTSLECDHDIGKAESLGVISYGFRDWIGGNALAGGGALDLEPERGGKVRRGLTRMEIGMRLRAGPPLHVAIGHAKLRCPMSACEVVAVGATGLMCANMLRAFQVGNALMSDGEPSSWMRSSRIA